MNKMICMVIVLMCTRGMMAQNLEVSSNAFKNGGDIPSYYTCDNKAMAQQPSPEISWSKGPKETKSYALMCQDPDAPQGTFVHWAVVNIPNSITTLPENASPLKKPAVELTNSSGQKNFVGPCPPSGKHRYFFRIYALDAVLDENLTIDQLKSEIEKHMLAQGELLGYYQRVSK